jgi:subtilisin-like proprotein convertase family protein
MAALNGSTPTGTWSLYVVDDCEVDSGSLTGVDLTIASSGGGGSPGTSSAVTVGDCCLAMRAATYASTIAVSGVAGQTTGLTVTLKGLSHGRAADLQVLLVGPGGQSAVLLSDTGGAASGADLTFAAAGSMVPATGAVTSGTYLPTDRPAACAGPTTPAFPSPAPAGPYGSSLSVFTGLGGGNVNGAWSLYVTDVCPGDSGSLALGWSLDISNNPTAVVVSSFVAKRLGQTRTVRLRWRTAQETSLLGFYVYRGQTKITRQLLAARSRGGTSGGSYSFTDKTAARGRAYTYRLQLVGMDGKKRFARTARLAAR